MLAHFTSLDDELAVGSCVTSPEHIDALTAAGVGAVVCLQTDEDLHDRGIRWPILWQGYTARRIRTTRVPIRDFDRKALARNLDEAVAAIRDHVESGAKTYVHCSAGINRSPTAIIAYIMAHRGLSLEAATSWLEERHRAVPFKAALKKWAKRARLPLSG